MNVNEISVEDAIQKAWRRRYFCIAVFIFLFLLSVGLIEYYSIHRACYCPSFLFTSIIVIALSNYVEQDWRIWAFSNVRNVHALRKRATEDGFMPAKGRLFELLEFNNEKYRMQWQELQKRFELPDNLTEDETIGNEIVFYFTKYARISKLIPNLIFLSIVFILMIRGSVISSENKSDKGSAIIGAVLLLLGLINIKKGYQRFMNRKAQLIFNQNGITLSDSNLILWVHISNEDIRPTYDGVDPDVRIYSLEFDVDGERKSIPLDEYSVSMDEARRALQTYRLRSSNNSR